MTFHCQVRHDTLSGQCHAENMIVSLFGDGCDSRHCAYSSGSEGQRRVAPLQFRQAWKERLAAQPNSELAHPILRARSKATDLQLPLCC